MIGSTPTAAWGQMTRQQQAAIVSNTRWRLANTPSNSMDIQKGAISRRNPLAGRGRMGSETGMEEEE